jgi:phage gpG-like protein
MGIIQAMKVLAQELKQLQRDAPRYIGELGVNHFNENFQRQGFVDDSLQPWDPRDPDRDEGRAVLFKSGTLRRSIRVVRRSSEQVVWGTDVKYAKVHNEGGDIQVKAHLRRGRKGDEHPIRAYMYRAKQRQFMGQSKQLTRKIEQYLDDRLKAIKTKVDQA